MGYRIPTSVTTSVPSLPEDHNSATNSVKGIRNTSMMATTATVEPASATRNNKHKKTT